MYTIFNGKGSSNWLWSTSVQSRFFSCLIGQSDVVLFQVVVVCVCFVVCMCYSGRGGLQEVKLLISRAFEDFIAIIHYTYQHVQSYCYCWLYPCRVGYSSFKDLVSVFHKGKLHQVNSRSECWSLRALVGSACNTAGDNSK